MTGRHHQDPTEVPTGEVNVDVDTHEVVRHTEEKSRDVIGRTRTTPTKHDGKQKKRS